MIRSSSIIMSSILFIGSIIFFIPQESIAQLSTIDNTSPSITQNINQVVDTSHITNPLRQGSRFAIESPDTHSLIDVINTNINGFDQAQSNTLSLVKNIINILLSFVAFIILIYFIYEGYMIVVAGTNQDQYKEALKKFKNAAIALAGIAASRFIVSFIFAALNAIIL